MTKRRLNITLTDMDVEEIEQLRALLEKRLLMRLSIAQIMRRMTKENLKLELANDAENN